MALLHPFEEGGAQPMLNQAIFVADTGIILALPIVSRLPRLGSRSLSAPSRASAGRGIMRNATSKYYPSARCAKAAEARAVFWRWWEPTALFFAVCGTFVAEFFNLYRKVWISAESVSGVLAIQNPDVVVGL